MTPISLTPTIIPTITVIPTITIFVILTINRKRNQPLTLTNPNHNQDDHRLQLKGEIDPGSEKFWNLELRGRPVELDEDNKEYTVEEAESILNKLYRVGKCAPSDLGINPFTEKPEV